MSGMLASVRSLEEAHIVFNAGADIIDLKEPESGALGAVSYDVAKTVVKDFKNKILISATIGDLPIDADIIDKAIRKMAVTNVDIIKVGIFSNSLTTEFLNCFQKHTKKGVKIVLVFFADQAIDIGPVFKSIDSNIIYGVMLDTADKHSGPLLKHRTLKQLSSFINLAKGKNLISGLAGSLRSQDISIILPLQADYLGFRGALCDQSQRTSFLDELSVYRIRSKIPDSSLNLVESNIELT